MCNTEQNYVGRGNNAIPPVPPAQNAAQPSSTPDDRRNELTELDIRFRTGEQFHQLYWGLTHQLRQVTADIVADFDPNDLESHLKRWHGFESILALFDQMIPALNFYANDLENTFVTEAEQRRRKTNRELRREEKLAYWQEKVMYHPLISDESTGEGEDDE